MSGSSFQPPSLLEVHAVAAEELPNVLPRPLTNERQSAPRSRGDRIWRLHVPPVDLQLLSPESPDRLLDDATSEDEIPFWAEIWDSSVGLTKYLVERSERTGPGILLDLGCGVGPVGCAAAALGWKVVMTDYLLTPLRYANRNLAANGLMASVVQADWRAFPLTGGFDVVTGSDVLYDPSLHPCLKSLWRGFRAAGAAIVAADPGRLSALNFAADLEREGWTVGLETRPGGEGPIALYSFS